MGTVDADAKSLQQRYISSRFSSVDEWPPYQPKRYTTLAFIHNKGKFTDAVRFSVAQELAVAGKIHVARPCKLSDLNISMTKNISDIFLPVKASDGSLVALRVLIEGAPGIGKTVLAKEIAYRWANNELLTSKKLLLLVFLRECSQTQLKSIKELVKHVFINDEMVPQLIKYLFKTEGKDTVIIFDGFDELSEENRKDSIIIDIINRRILTKSCLVITSRPTASSTLHGSVDRRVEIVGFTKEDRLNYIQTALEDNNEQVKALQHYLQSNPTINALCYIPLNMTILLCLAEDGIDKLPKTQTEMYKKFIEMTIVRFVKKHENRTLLIKVGELPHPHNKLFVELAKLAYNALKIDKIVFTLSEIKESCPNLTIASNNWNGLGLLKAVQYFSVELGNDQVTFHFLHFSIQEYMAAWYISKLSNNEQIKLLKKNFWKHRYYNTWIMYIGITSGSSFALRHFLSGNWFQLYSKLFKNSKVSNKYLKNKMRCLHLFQCLVEANREDIIVSVKKLFQNNQIDLSNQTLLPSDLNILGFFLVRSLNKEWDELDLSNCNIGSEGCNVLCDRFLDKDVRCIFTIKIVNFSYNQLNLSSIVRLFGLFNSWNTSEIIITDDVVLDNKADNKTIEDIILQSDTLVLVFIGSYLFSKNLQSSKMVRILSNTTNIECIYLLNCSWKSSKSKTSELLLFLKAQALSKVRIIGPSLDKCFIRTMALMLLCNNNYVNMFVHDPTMSDEISDDICSVISKSSKDISGVMLIVSGSKVQGIVNTHTLSNELSALEIFNLNQYVRYFNTKTYSWRDSFESKCEIIVGTFVKLLYIIKSNWQLKIAMIENDVLIVHKAKFGYIGKHNRSIMHYSGDVNKLDYDKSYYSESPDYVQLLHTKLLHKQSVPNELFIYGDIEDSLMNSLIELISHHHHNISAVLVTNDVIVGHNPNIQQIALAFQLQPSTTKWVLCSPVSAIVFHQIVDALVTFHNHWIKLDFTCCNIGDVECEIMHRNLKLINHSLTFKKLNISFNKLTVSGIPYLVRIILVWGVQELIIHGTNDILYDCLINNLTNGSNGISNLLINYSNRLVCIVYNITKKITKRLISEMYIINCDLQFSNFINTLHNLLRLCVINGTVSERNVVEILKVLTFSNEVLEVSLSNVRIINDDRMIRKLLTSREFYLDIKLNLVLSTDHWLCVCSATKYQLHFIHHYLLKQHCNSIYTPLIMGLILNEQINGNIVYIFENDQVNFVRVHAKEHQTTGITQVIAALIHATSLNTIDIDNYTITSEDADHLVNIIHNNTQLQEISLNGNNLQTNNTIKIAKALHCVQAISFHNNNVTDEAADDIAAAISCNTKLQELNLSGNNLQKAGVIKIVKALRDISTLRKLYLSNVSITDEVADDIAAVISCNIHLQELNLGSNNLQSSGTIKIAKSLQKVSSLTKLYINNSNITHEAADDIATVISCNIHLQELNLGSNNLQASGTIKIAKSLQKILSLTKLYINNSNITHEAADDIATVISCNAKLQEFNLSGNNLQKAGVIKVVKALRDISTLRKLYLSNVGITDEVADDIAAAISCNTQIEVLDISGNNFKVMGAMKIGENLQRIYTSKTLFISNNTADDVAAVISNDTCLQELYIYRKNFQTIDAKAIVKALQGVHTLTKIHFGNNNISDEAANYFATIVSCSSKLKELELSRNKLKTASAIKIMKALQKIYTLEKLYLNNNNITDEAADDIAAAVSCNIHLQELNLSNNNLQAQGTIRIAKSLQNISSLTKLYINDNNITPEAADDIGTAISCNSNLQEFDVSGNNLKTSVVRIVKALKDICTLRRLCLSNSNITCTVADDVAAVISCNTQMEEFDVSKNNIQAMGAIAKSLQHICTLKKLCMSNNNITDEAADDIAAAISCNIHLQELNLGSNNLKASGIIKIAKSLQNISSLTKLYINHNNVNITNEAANDIATAISCNIKLQELNFGSNNLHTSGTIKIAKTLQKIPSLTKLYINNSNITHEAADDIATVISCNAKLQEFNLSGNNLQKAGVIKVVKALRDISTLRKLYLSNVGITDEVADDIAAAISCNTQIEVLDISGNNFKVMGAMKIGENLQRIYTSKTLFISNNTADDVAAVISNDTCLQELYIYRKNFQTIDAKAIVKALQGVHTLTKIHFGNNNISDEAANYFATIVSCSSKLKELELSRNKLKTASAIKIMKALQKIYTLEKLYLNNNNITDEAADDIAAAVSCNIHLQELNLSNNNLQAQGTIRIAKSLQNISSLTKLYINDNNITPEAADDIGTAISCNSNLQEFDVSGNNLKTSVVRIVKALKDICTLRRLCLSNSNITCTVADDVAAVISCNTQMEEFDVSKNNIQAMGAIAKSLQHICTLKKLCISNNNITHEAADDIAAVILCNIHLQELNLGCNYLQTSGTIKIAKSLQKISSLTKLFINDNNITDEAADDIAAAISCNAKLQEFNSSKNNLQKTGIIKIVKALRDISTLKKLCLSNISITDEVADDIAAAISCICLQELYLGSNNLQASDIIKIAKSLQKISSLTKLYINHNNITHEAANDIAAAISCNIHLQELNLASNNLQTSGIIKIAKSLQRISLLTNLYINNNNVTDEAAGDIAAAISCNIHLQELNLGNNYLQASGMIKIAKSLQKISSLTKLYINHNNITHEAVDDIAAAISCNIHLQEFNMRGHLFNSSGALKIAAALQKISNAKPHCS